MSTLVVYSSVGDGNITSGDGESYFGGSPGHASEPSWSVARSGVGSSKFADTGAGLLVGDGYSHSDADGYDEEGHWYSCDKGVNVAESFLGFDTSSIGSGSTVSSATLTLTSGGDYSDTDFTIEARLRDWGGTLTTADYVPGADLSGDPLLASRATSGGWVSGTSYAFTSETAFAANINKTGTTYLCLSSSHTRTDNAPTGAESVAARSADYTGTTSDPKLTLEYSSGRVPDGPGPTLDATILRSSGTKTFTAAAILKGSGSGNFTADAVVFGTRPGSFTADAVIAKPQAGSLTAEALLLRPQAGSFSTAATIKKSQAASFAEDAIRLKTWVFGQGGGGGGTLVVYADAADGALAQGSGWDDTDGYPGDYSSCRAGTAEASLDSTSDRAYVGQASTAVWYYAVGIHEVFVGFNTASIPDADTISSATLTLTSYGDESTTDFTIEARLYDWGGTLLTDDWVPGANLSGLPLLASRATSAGWVEGTSYDLTSESAFAANVSKTGTTRLCLSSSRTRLNNAPGGAEFVHVRTANYTGTTSDPKLTVEYTGGGAVDGPGPTIDAVLRKGQAGSFAANAIIKRTATSALAADAVIRATTAASFTASAIVTRTAAIAFMADAVLLSPVGVSVTADAVVLATRPGSAAADAIIRRTQQHALWENHYTHNDAHYEVWGTRQAAQTFSSTVAMEIDRVDIGVHIEGTPPNALTVEIQTTSGGDPTGTVLASGSLAVGGVGTDEGVVHRIVLDRKIQLAASTTYALVISTTGGDANNDWHWNFDSTSADYSNGQKMVKAGPVWTAFPTQDFLFAVLVGTPITLDATLTLKRLGNFSVDAAIAKAQETVSGSFVSDAVFAARQPASITTDAIALRVFTSAITSNAIVSANLAATLSAGAVIQSSSTTFLTADAIRSSVIAGSFSGNAAVRRTAEDSESLDAIVQRTSQPSLTADTIVRRTQIASFAADAEIAPLTKAGSFTASAFVSKAGYGFITVNATIFGSRTGSLCADAITLRAGSGSVTAAANISVTEAGVVNASATFLRTASAAVAVDAVIQATSVGSFTASAISKRTTTAAFVSDAVLVGSITRSATADAVIARTGSGSVSAAAIFLSHVTGAVSASAWVASPKAGYFTADAVIWRTHTGFLTARAIAKRTASATFAAEASIALVTTSSFTADAVQQKIASSSITAKAVLGQARTGGLSTDAILLSAQARTFSANALIAVGFYSITADALIQSLTAGSFSANASISPVIPAWIGATTTAATIAATPSAVTIAGTSSANQIAGTSSAASVGATTTVASIDSTWFRMTPVHGFTADAVLA